MLFTARRAFVYDINTHMTSFSKAKLLSLYRHILFRPTFLGLILNPFYSARKGLFQKLSILKPNVKGRVLDVGCGHKPYKSLFQATEYCGLELDTEYNRLNKAADFYYDGKSFPFSNESFDTVLLNQVIEHVLDTDTLLKEISRVLKRNGGLVITVPFIWDEHEIPNDYMRYSSFGIKQLLSAHGFNIIEHHKSLSDIRIIFQIANCYFYKILSKLPVFIKYPLLITLTCPLNIIGEILYWVSPNNYDLYLDNVIYASKVPK